MADAVMSRIHSSTTWSIVLSLLMIVAGLLAIGLPGVAGLAVTALIGWLLMFSGILHLVFAWRAGQASGVVWEILLGVVYGAMAIYLLARPAMGLASLTLALAFYLFAEGVLELILSFRLRDAWAGTGWLVLDGIVTLILAAMIWSTWPFSTVWTIGTLLGVSMLFSGISRLMLTLSARRVTA